MTTQKRTPLYDWHVKQGGRMVDFAGWEMPVQYAGIVAEHAAVRTAAGLFDVSHMGRLFLSGSNAAAVIAAVVTSDVESLPIGRVRYGLVLADDGGTIDDVLVTHLAEHSWLVVANASGRQQVLACLQSAAQGKAVQVDDRTEDLAMLAVQGPDSIAIVDGLFEGDDRPSSLRYYRSMALTTADGIPMTVSRTGYTGEDGFELIFEAARVTHVADTLVAAGVVPAGLGARDTLRLEAGMPLYGHELSREIDPITAGLGFAVRSSGGFTGAESLNEKEKTHARVGIVFQGKRPVREGAKLFSGETGIGEVTSGTSSPTLGQPIAMGFVELGCQEPGAAVEAEVRGTRIAGEIVPLPFLKK